MASRFFLLRDETMIANEALRQCWFLAGPTAGGKTATALELADQLNAEIVSMDSMAIYREMDIGTAKPTAEEQKQAVHHLIDVADPADDFAVSEYVTLAAASVEQILNRSRVPLFVGGTGLYLRSLLRGVFEGPEADWELRRELEQQAQTRGNEWLHQQLAEVDEVTAARLHPNDLRRVVRAIEVYRLTGKPLSQHHQNGPLPEHLRPNAVFWIDPPRDWLHSRINRRVDLMMERGLFDETKRLLDRKPPIGRTARQGLGYRELIEHFEDGVPLAEAVENIKTGTRQFAKRQHTWFRNLAEVRSVPIDGSESAKEMADKLVSLSAS